MNTVVVMYGILARGVLVVAAASIGRNVLQCSQPSVLLPSEMNLFEMVCACEDTRTSVVAAAKPCIASAAETIGAKASFMVVYPVEGQLRLMHY